VTREQYDAIYATVLAAQRHDSLRAHFYVSEILAIVSDEVTDNRVADGRRAAAAGARPATMPLRDSSPELAGPAVRRGSAQAL
jgi:hypothetical protein